MDMTSEKDLIYQFVEKGNFHAAINIAISCLNQCRRDSDQVGVDEFLAIIQGIVDTMVETFGSNQ